MTRIPAAVCLFLLAATAFAAEQKERARPDAAFVRDTTAQREVAPLLFALPYCSGGYAFLPPNQC